MSIVQARDHRSSDEGDAQIRRPWSRDSDLLKPKESFTYQRSSFLLLSRLLSSLARDHRSSGEADAQIQRLWSRDSDLLKKNLRNLVIFRVFLVSCGIGTKPPEQIRYLQPSPI